MNSVPPPLGDEAIDREWQLQERALREERERAGIAGAGARLLRYRLVAGQLLVPVGQTPAAESVRTSALEIERLLARKRRAAARLEFIFIAAFVVAFGVCTVAAVAFFGTVWAPARAALSAAVSNPWLLALLGCAGLSQLIAGATRMRAAPRASAAQ